MRFNVKRRYFLILIAIIAWGAFLRLFRIQTIPPGLYPDVAANGLDALDILNGRILPFYHRNGGREGMFFYVVAFFLTLLGNKPLALYLASSFVGIITIPIMYLFGKTFYNRRIALISTFFLASSFYHINFSRLGYRVILLPIFLMLPLITLKKAFMTREKKDWLLAGMVFSLGFYTYIAYRIFPLLLLFAWFVFRKKIKNVNLKSFEKRTFILGVFITLLPFLIYTLRFPIDVFIRVIDARDSSITTNIIATLKMFHLSGDPLKQYNIANEPIFTLWEGFIFLIGFFCLVKNWQRLSNFIILILFGGMLLPIMLSESAPHSLRGLGIVTPMYIILALGLDKTHIFIKQKTNASLATLSVLILLCFSASTGYKRYFHTWATQENLEKEFYTDLVEMTSFIKELPTDQPRYLLLASMRNKKRPVKEIVARYHIPIPDYLLTWVIRTWEPKRSPESNIDHGDNYFWEGNTVKYLLYDTNYRVLNLDELDSKDKGVYLFSNLWHPDYKEPLLATFPKANLLEENNHFQAWSTN